MDPKVSNDVFEMTWRDVFDQPQTFAAVRWTAVAYVMLALGGVLALLLEQAAWVALILIAPGVCVLIAARHTEARRLGVGPDTERLKLTWSDIALGFVPVLAAVAALVLFDAAGQWLGLVLAVMVIGSDLSQRRRARLLRRSVGPRTYRI